MGTRWLEPAFCFPIRAIASARMEQGIDWRCFSCLGIFGIKYWVSLFSIDLKLFVKAQTGSQYYFWQFGKGANVGKIRDFGHSYLLQNTSTKQFKPCNVL